jgi:hypothetical protein
MRSVLEPGARDTDGVPLANAGEPEHLVVQQSAFAGDRFWAALNRLAERRGHDGHQTYLVGETERTHRYALQCVTCGQAVAVMVVEREQPVTAL